MNSPIIRKVIQHDLPFLIPMVRRFVEESSLPFTFDVETTVSYFASVMESENTIILVEEDDGIITGGILGTVDRDFCRESCAYVIKMYVEKEFRGLGTARALVEAFEDEARKLGASIIFVSATAGMGDRAEKLYIRLLERYGFVTLGRVLCKEI